MLGFDERPQTPTSVASGTEAPTTTTSAAPGVVKSIVYTDEVVVVPTADTAPTDTAPIDTAPPGDAAPATTSAMSPQSEHRDVERLVIRSEVPSNATVITYVPVPTAVGDVAPQVASSPAMEAVVRPAAAPKPPATSGSQGSSTAQPTGAPSGGDGESEDEGEYEGSDD